MNKEQWMNRAIELADYGKGAVNPNPLVGAVIVKNGQIIGEGYHEKFGHHHAEVNAFLNATDDVEGADMYVTLEPCSHHGKTPPCALKIIEKKIKKVYISQLDPNPLVSGKGVELLKQAGIEVEHGLLSNITQKQNEIFFKYIKTKTPFVAIKYAMTLDGKIATVTKDSKWITNDASRAYVHELRNHYQAILVGVGTIISDNPTLDTRRNQPSRNPVRIIIDQDLVISLDAHVVQTAKTQQTIIYTKTSGNQRKIALLREKGVDVYAFDADPSFDFKVILNHIGSLNIDSVFVEGGSMILSSFIEQQVVDKAYVFIGPKVIGGSLALTPVGGHGVKKMSDAYVLSNIDIKRFQNDLLIEGYFNKQGE